MDQAAKLPGWRPMKSSPAKSGVTADWHLSYANAATALLPRPARRFRVGPLVLKPDSFNGDDELRSANIRVVGNDR